MGFKVVLAVDRAGLIGEDGETHHGVFDVPFLNTIPGVTIFSPSFLEELEPMLGNAAFVSRGVSAVRYPKGGEFKKPQDFKYTGNDFDFYGDKSSDMLIVTYGRLFSNVYLASEILKNSSISVCILKLNVIKPLDFQAVNSSLKFKNTVFFEESIKSGGAAEKFGAELIQRKYKGSYIIKAIDGKFVPHGTVDSQFKKFSFDVAGMVDTIKKILNLQEI